MFMDFALLTEQQGELLDQIEFQVKQASDHVEQANEETYQAIEYQKEVRKKSWYVGVFSLLLLFLNPPFGKGTVSIRFLLLLLRVLL